MPQFWLTGRGRSIWPAYHPKIRQQEHHRKPAPHFVKGVLRHFKQCATVCQSILIQKPNMHCIFGIQINNVNIFTCQLISNI